MPSRFANSAREARLVSPSARASRMSSTRSADLMLATGALLTDLLFINMNVVQDFERSGPILGLVWTGVKMNSPADSDRKNPGRSKSLACVLRGCGQFAGGV